MKQSIKNRIYNKCVACIIICLSATVLLSGCSSKDATIKDPITKSTFLLNTIVTISLYDSTDESIITEAFQLISQYEKIYSRTSESSELYKLNEHMLPESNGTYTVSNDLADILKKAYYYSELTDGAFDLAIEPVSSLWDFQSETPVVPDSEEIAKHLPAVDYHNVHIDGNKVSFDSDDTGVDLGAIAKGYIADRVKDFLIDKGVNSAMINLGGNVLCVGEKPDGSPFSIGIQKPFADRNETVAVMKLKDKSVVSSGIYERYFTVNDTFYHHILNSKTGYPTDNDLIAVTIVSDYSVDGDGLSTSVFALGLDKGMELIDSMDNVYAVFITDDYELHYSNGFKENIDMQS